MSQEQTVLVATVNHPDRRFRITKSQFEKAKAEAKRKKKPFPLVVQEDDCEGGKSFDQLSEKEKKEVIERQKAKREALKEKEQEEEESDED